MRYIAALGAITHGMVNGFTPGVIFFLFFVVYSIPLGYIRLKFRQAVYHKKGVGIALKPVFTKEIKALFGAHHSEDPRFERYRRWYRWYLIGFVVLYISWKLLDTSIS